MLTLSGGFDNSLWDSANLMTWWTSKELVFLGVPKIWRIFRRTGVFGGNSESIKRGVCHFRTNRYMRQSSNPKSLTGRYCPLVMVSGFSKFFGATWKKWVWQTTPSNPPGGFEFEDLSLEGQGVGVGWTPLSVWFLQQSTHQPIHYGFILPSQKLTYPPEKLASQ